MTAPDPAPTTKLTETRAKLYAALQEAMELCGWEGRHDSLPPRQFAAPWGWVDAATLSVASQAGVPAGTIAATIPVVVALDGADREQVEQMDNLMAYGWQLLDRVDRARVITAGPQFIDLPAGVETRAVVFSVQVTILARTLCSGSLTDSHEAPAPPAP